LACFLASFKDSNVENTERKVKELLINAMIHLSNAKKNFHAIFTLELCGSKKREMILILH
jgi:hypothetical protein